MRAAMLGTSPIAVAMPADPVNFWYDCATTVVPRGKLEVYNKAEKPLRSGWAADENGLDCTDAARVLHNIIGNLGGGIFILSIELRIYTDAVDDVFCKITTAKKEKITYILIAMCHLFLN